MMFGNSNPFGTAPSFLGTTNIFGSKSTTNNVFSNSSFGNPTPIAPISNPFFLKPNPFHATGTNLNCNAAIGTDTFMRGVSQRIGIKRRAHMTEYENKKLKKFRAATVAKDRKSGNSAEIGFGCLTQQTCLFGQPTTSSSAFSFAATTQSKPLLQDTTRTATSTNVFGLRQFVGQPSQTQNNGPFGKSVGSPATSTGPVFSFGVSPGTPLWRKNNEQKPSFIQTSGRTGFFSNTATTHSAGLSQNTTFRGIETASQPMAGMFITKPTGFGTPSASTNNSFSFRGANNVNCRVDQFGKTPAAPFLTTPFGSHSSVIKIEQLPANNPFKGTGSSKTATSAYGNTQNMFGRGCGSSFGTSPNLLPTSSGLGNNTGIGLLGNTANKAPSVCFGNTGFTFLNFGVTNPSTSTFNFGRNTTITASDPNKNAALQKTQQQISRMNSSRNVEISNPVYSSVQKALLNHNQSQIVPLATIKVKPKPWSLLPYRTNSSSEIEILKLMNTQTQKILLNGNRHKIVPLTTMNMNRKPWFLASSGKYRIGTTKKKVHCEAAMHVTVKRIAKYTGNSGSVVEARLTKILKFECRLNHAVQNEEAYSWLRQSKETRTTVISYFNNGMYPAAAKMYYADLIRAAKRNKLTNSRMNSPSNWLCKLRDNCGQSRFSEFKSTRNYLSVLEEERKTPQETECNLSVQDAACSDKHTPLRIHETNEQTSETLSKENKVEEHNIVSRMNIKRNETMLQEFDQKMLDIRGMLRNNLEDESLMNQASGMLKLLNTVQTPLQLSNFLAKLTKRSMNTKKYIRPSLVTRRKFIKSKDTLRHGHSKKHLSLKK